MTAATAVAGRPVRLKGNRERTLDAAGELLVARGLAALTVEAVAERAGTSTRAVQRWWPSQEALALDTLRHEWLALAAHVYRGALQSGLR